MDGSRSAAKESSDRDVHAPVSTPRFYTLAEYNDALTADPGELDLRVSSSVVDGAIPSDLVGGTYLHNGPSRLRLGGQLTHPFDGHGFVRSCHFTRDGGVHLRARFVRSQAFIDENEVQRLVYRGIGTRTGRLRDGSVLEVLRQFRHTKNVGNTTITAWGGKLLAGYEGGLPHVLDPTTLDTLGLENFGVLSTTNAVLAHVRVDAERQRLVTASPRLGHTTEITFHELDAAGRLVSTMRHEIPCLSLLHDFVITQHHYVLLTNPIRASWSDLALYFLGRRTLLDVITGDDRAPGAVVVLPRSADAGPAHHFTLASPLFAVHYVNAYATTRDDRVVLDVCGLDDNVVTRGAFGYAGPDAAFDPTQVERRTRQKLYRLTLNLVDGTARVAVRSHMSTDFPRVHPRREGMHCRVMHAAGRSDRARTFPFDSVVQIDLDDVERPEALWTPGRARFVGEPLFAPRPDAVSTDETDGWLLVLVTDAAARRTDLCILDAGDVERGPVARVPLPFMPYAFHGSYVEPSSVT